MKTSKPVSFISWNSADFLKQTLDDLIDSHVISFYFYMFHFGEHDDRENPLTKKKDHFHVYCECGDSKIDTCRFIEYFEELQEKGVNRPSAIVTSKTDHAILYFMHDVMYLAEKGCSREYHYKYDEFVSSDFYKLDEYYHNIDYSKMNGNKSARFRKCIESGMSFADLLRFGYIPIQQINSYKTAFEIFSDEIEKERKKQFDV